MMWVLFAAMALAVVVALMWPLMRSQHASVDGAEYDLTVFRDQLAEVDRDVARGVLTAAEAEAARIEIKRRMIAASKRAGTTAAQAPRANALLTAGVAIVPFVALGVYLLVGAPQLPGQQTAQASRAQEMSALLEKLAARMKQTPDDPQGWALLARSYRQMEKYAEAAEAYRNLMRLEPDNVDALAGFGEAAIGAANSTVTAEARDALLRALQLDRNEPRAQFYLGLERAQADDTKGAIAIWRALSAAAPPDASWLPSVRAQMMQLGQSTNTMPMGITPRHALEVFGVASAAPAPVAAAPGAPNVDALKGSYSAEEVERIQGMVGGLVVKLEADPNSYDGWMLLGRSYIVLNNVDGARMAYAQAIRLKPADPAPKVQLSQLFVGNAAGPSAQLVSLASEIRKETPQEPLALFILGADKAQGGDAAAARKLWQDASAGLPEGAPLREEIARRLATLK